MSSKISSPGVKRNDYEAAIARLSDEDLVAEARIRIVLHYRSHGASRHVTRPYTTMCWYECCDRGKPELYTAALDQAKEELGKK